MIIVAQMQSGGCFEAENKRKLSQQMIQHFGENDEEAGQIKSLFYVLNDDRTDEICQRGIDILQEIIDEGVAEWRKIADEEYRGQKEIERDYWATVL